MPIKARRLLVEVQSYVKAKLFQYWQSIPKSRATGRKIVSRKRKSSNKNKLNANQGCRNRDEKSPELDDRTVEESWNGRPRNNIRSYFDSLSKMAKAKNAERTKRKVKSNRMPKSSLVTQKKRKFTSNLLPRSSVATQRKRKAQPKPSSNVTTSAATQIKRRAQSKPSSDVSTSVATQRKRKAQSKPSSNVSTSVAAQIKRNVRKACSNEKKVSNTSQS